MQNECYERHTYNTHDIFKWGNVLTYSANIGVKLIKHASGLETISTLTNSLKYDCDFKSW